MYSKPPLPPQPPRLGALASKPPYASRRRAVTDLGNPTAIEMAKSRTMQVCQDRPVGLLETDLDAPEEGDESAVGATTAGKKTRSLLNLNQSGHPRATGDLATDNALHVPQSPSGAAHRTPNDANHHQRPHKSMEFLLDKENLHFVKVKTVDNSFGSTFGILLFGTRCSSQTKIHILRFERTQTFNCLGNFRKWKTGF